MTWNVGEDVAMAGPSYCVGVTRDSWILEVINNRLSPMQVFRSSLDLKRLPGHGRGRYHRLCAGTQVHKAQQAEPAKHRRHRRQYKKERL